MSANDTTGGPQAATSVAPGSEASQTGGSITPREGSPTHGTPDSTYSTNATDAEANVDGSRDASRDGARPNEVAGVRAGSD